jgi:phospholipid/cholesterol/gamma-HCH transport system substrate-binding protein
VVGAFVLVALGFLMWLMLSSGKTSNLFEEQLTFYGELSSTQAVNKGTEVIISGLSVGTVTAVEITEDNQIILTMNILKKYHNLLRTDSSAKLTSFDFAVIAKSIIEISPGSADLPLLADGSTIKVGETINFKDLIGKIEPIFTTLEKSINRMNQILAQVDPAQLKDTLDNVHAASKNIDDIAKATRYGNGIIKTALYDPAFKQDIQTTMANMHSASVKMNQLLDALNEQVALVPELLNKVGPLLQEADKTIKASQRIWPLSSAVGEAEDRQTLTSPEPAND